MTSDHLHWWSARFAVWLAGWLVSLLTFACKLPVLWVMSLVLVAQRVSYGRWCVGVMEIFRWGGRASTCLVPGSKSEGDCLWQIGCTVVGCVMLLVRRALVCSFCV